jgi:hypothetical protein
MEWTWNKAEETSIARFATDQALQLFELKDNIFDLVQTKDVETILQGIYETLVAQNIQYDLEKFNSSTTEQRIRTPVEVLVQPHQGTCLDLSLVFCGLCLGCRLLPKLVLLEGHALVVVSLTLTRDQFDKNSGSDSHQKDFLGRRYKNSQGELRMKPEVFKNKDLLIELIEFDHVCCAIECTGFASSKSLEGRNQAGYLTFEQAKEVGLEKLKQLDLIYAIDIAIAQEHWGLKPPMPFDIPNGLQKLPERIVAKAELNYENFKDGDATGIDATGRNLEGGAELNAILNTKTMEGGSQTGVRL